VRTPTLNRFVRLASIRQIQIIKKFLLPGRYPTALDLTGLSAKINPSLEGFSLVPLLKDPTLHERAPSSWKQAAFSQYPRCMNSSMASQPPFLATRDPCVGDNANQVKHSVAVQCFTARREDLFSASAVKLIGKLLCL
jgi:hypothetical protein